MSTIYMVKNIKELFPEYVLLVKIGTFYKNCGFPTNSLNKVLSMLENNSINYIVVDKKHNYEEETKMNFKRKNKYDELLTKSIKYIDFLILENLFLMLIRLKIKKYIKQDIKI